jgi:hypothetical protein
MLNIDLDLELWSNGAQNLFYKLPAQDTGIIDPTAGAVEVV